MKNTRERERQRRAQSLDFTPIMAEEGGKKMWRAEEIKLRGDKIDIRDRTKRGPRT